jgi:hypothetical protein
MVNGIENDRILLSKQWNAGKINPRIKARYENNIRKLEIYEDEFMAKQEKGYFKAQAKAFLNTNQPNLFSVNP